MPTDSIKKNIPASPSSCNLTNLVTLKDIILRKDFFEQEDSKVEQYKMKQDNAEDGEK